METRFTKFIKENYHPERWLKENPKNASFNDLLAVVVGGVNSVKSMNVVSETALKYMEPLGGSDDLNYLDLLSIPGMTENKALKICAAVELGRRLAGRFDKIKMENFSEPGKVADFFMEKLRHENQERFITAYVNVKNRLLGWKEITKGNVSAAPIDIQEALKWGIRYKARGLILVHNHPSGDPEPSDEDIAVTKAFVKAARILDMEVLDHVIIGDGIFVSLREERSKGIERW